MADITAGEAYNELQKISVLVGNQDKEVRRLTGENCDLHRVLRVAFELIQYHYGDNDDSPLSELDLERMFERLATVSPRFCPCKFGQQQLCATHKGGSR